MHRLILFVLMLGFSILFLGQQQKNDLDQVLRLFPGFHIVMVEEFDPDTRAFVHSHFPKDSPSVVRGDFDGDGVMDYALLLKDSNPDRQSWLPYVLLASSAAASIDSM